MDDKIYLEPHEATCTIFLKQEKKVFIIKADGTPMLGSDATVDDAARVLVDALAEGMHRYISSIKADNEQLREALRAINRKNDNPAWFNSDIHEIVETALQQKDSD